MNNFCNPNSLVVDADRRNDGAAAAQRASRALGRRRGRIGLLSGAADDRGDAERGADLPRLRARSRATAEGAPAIRFRPRRLCVAAAHLSRLPVSVY